MLETEPSRILRVACLASLLTLFSQLANIAPIKTVSPARANPLPVQTAQIEDAEGCILGDREAQQPLTALIPTEDRVISTLARYPTLLFYLPPTAAERAEFILYDNRRQPLYKVAFVISGEGGIISLNLPTKINLQPLEIGQRYGFSLSLICDPSAPDRNLTVGGRIERIELPERVEMEIENAPLGDRPRIYAEAGLWLDALTQLAALRRANPNDPALLREWESTLNALGLEPIAQAPFVNP
jgi:hypothetical protein